MKVVVLSAARADILRQYEYYLIEKDAETAAERFIDAVQTSIALMSKNPLAGSPKTLTSRKIAGLRCWPVKGFDEIRIYYLVRDDEALVVRVLHGRRDIYSLLGNQ